MMKLTERTYGAKHVHAWLMSVLIVSVFPLSLIPLFPLEAWALPIKTTAAKMVAHPVSALERANRAKAIERSSDISANPSDTEITALRIFPEPLIPMTSKPVPSENPQLAKALKQYKATGSPDDISPLTNFIAKYPQSRSRASLELNLGLVRFKAGYLRDASSFWKSAYKRAGSEKRAPQLS